tara:strand:- start:489 stop:629 length:141 start_codon:yes stop_codon:yes gene_type:complete
MKKLLGILVLDLLWCNAASSFEGYTFEFQSPKSSFFMKFSKVEKKF